ncbi:MAG: hypothetical protein AAFO95_20760 [Cyanobacteria bacterium J06600_6]
MKARKSPSVFRSKYGIIFPLLYCQAAIAIVNLQCKVPEWLN